MWSFVTIDGIQDAALFPFKDSSLYRESKLKKIECKEPSINESSELIVNDDQSMGTSDNADESLSDKASLDEVLLHPIITPEKRRENDHAVNVIAEIDIDEEYKNKFQAKMVRKIQRGVIQSSSKDSTASWDKATWPKCGWWMKSIGSFGVTRWTEYPIMAPYVVLGDFIEQLGRWDACC